MPANPRTDTATPQNGRVPLGFGNLFASPGDHIGHFYENREEWKGVLVLFLQTGLAAGDKCVYFMSGALMWSSQHLNRYVVRKQWRCWDGRNAYSRCAADARRTTDCTSAHQ